MLSITIYRGVHTHIHSYVAVRLYSEAQISTKRKLNNENFPDSKNIFNVNFEN